MRARIEDENRKIRHKRLKMQKKVTTKVEERNQKRNCRLNGTKTAEKERKG